MATSCWIVRNVLLYPKCFLSNLVLKVDVVESVKFILEKMGRPDDFINSKLICFKFCYQSSGNRTPGSRFYCDLLNTSVCIHQLVLRRRSKRKAARVIVGG